MELSGQRQARPGCFVLWDRASGSHSLRGWVGPKARLDACENKMHLLHCRKWNQDSLGIQSVAQSAYRLLMVTAQTVYFRTYCGLTSCSKQTDLDLYRRHQS